MYGSNNNRNPFGNHTYGLKPSEQTFFMDAARDSAGAVREMLPDAMQVVKLAAGILGILAIGVAVIENTQSSR